jgi:hypothetical protein
MKYLFTLLAALAFLSLTAVSQASLSTSTTSTTATTDVPARSFARKDAPVHIPRLASAPSIDGVLNDAAWQNAAVFGDFLQTQPGDNIAPTRPTEVMMGYDSKNLYIAFRVTEERSKIRASIARRDNIFDDDYIGVYLDTFNDQRQAYVFFFNPLGIQADGTFQEGNGEDYSVDLVYTSKGVLTDDGYTIEAAIPFRVLRYTAGKDKNWGIHIFRRFKDNNNELDSWMPGNRSVSGSLNKAGKITGLEGIETARQIEVNPSITLSESGRRSRHTFDGNPNGRYVNDHVKADLGFTAKLGLTPTTTLDFAYNPDFAQVEADAPVTSANQRFPIFYPEKRPFFLERIDMFKSPMDLVNTRSIVDPDVAAKLTGKSGKNTYGLILASDNAPGNYSPDERDDLRRCQAQRLVDPTKVCSLERFMDKNATIGVLRYKRDVGKESSIGLFGTSYSFIDNHNHTGGVDGRLRFDKATVMEFQVVGTTSRRNFYDPNSDSVSYRTGNGLGYSVWLERAGRNWYMNYLVNGNSSDYRANVGFTNRTDTNYAGLFIQYKTTPDAKRTIIWKRLQNESNIRYDWKGRSQYAITNTQGTLMFHRQTAIGATYQYGYERVFEHEFGPARNASQSGAFFGGDPERSARFNCVQFFIESTPQKKLYLFFFTDNTWGLMDYDFGGGPKFPRASYAAVTFGQNAPLDPGPGHQLYIESRIRYQPTTALQTQLNYNKVRLRRDDTRLIAFDDNIFSSRTTYQFSRNLSARLRLDYSSLQQRLRPQLVLGWTPSPGKAVYVGYSDDFNYNAWNPYTRVREPGLQSNGRTFFIKMSYLFKKSF